MTVYSSHWLHPGRGLDPTSKRDELQYETLLLEVRASAAAQAALATLATVGSAFAPTFVDNEHLQ